MVFNLLCYWEKHIQKKETERRPDVDKSHNSISSHKWLCIKPFRPVLHCHKDGLVPTSGLKLITYATLMILTTLKT